MRAQARIDMSTEGVPLTLAPLLSAYGRHRRILLRVENLPERARLSRGRNNGDRSWSLMRDELEDLVYLPPQGSDAAHTLAVRVINLEGDGETLALHELAIEPNGVQSRSGTKQAPSASVAELRKLREDLASTKTALKARERELASEQAQTARARADATRFEDALASCDRGLRIEPRHCVLWCTRAVALMNLGRLEEALVACARGLEIKPSDAKLHENKALILRWLNGKSDAGSHLNREEHKRH
jgi:tetratricopeptide (TPR) repeat protein